MGFFRDRRRARAEAEAERTAESEAADAASLDGQDAMTSEEARLAAEARRMLLGGGGEDDDDSNSTGMMTGGTTGTATCTSSTSSPCAALSPEQEQKILALHYRFDADRDGYLSHPELRNLQQTTSGAAMSEHEYIMICHALGCDPQRGIGLDALRVTYASAQGESGGEANLELDYERVFGTAAGAGGGSTDAPSRSRRSTGGSESDITEASADGRDDDDEQQPQMIGEAEIPVEEADAPRLEMGDHVFRRRAAGLSQVHAIVVSMAAGEDGPLLLADFTGQNVVGEGDEDDSNDDDHDDDHDDDNDCNIDDADADANPQSMNGDGDDGQKDQVVTSETAAARPKEQPPDPTVERVRIICIEGRKNIRKWKKVRYGGSRFGGWFQRKKGKEKVETPSRKSKSAVADGSTVSATTSSRDTPVLVSSADEFVVGSSTKDNPNTSSLDIVVGGENYEGKLQPQPHTPKTPKDNGKKKDDDLPETDPGTLVVERVNFLLENQNLIPPWHALKSNSECLAVWCKTGRWSTYQVSGYLNTIFMGQAKTAATVAAAASTATVTVPAAGYMGWLGFTTQVSLLALHPWLIPAIAGYGIASIGVPMYILKRCGKQWAKTTIDLNNEFWCRAPPEVFVDCIRKWSDLDDDGDVQRIL